MKNRRKKFVVIIGAMMFAIMMAFSVTTSMNGTDFSLLGMESLAGGTTCTGGQWNVCCAMWDIEVTPPTEYTCHSGGDLICSPDCWLDD